MAYKLYNGTNSTSLFNPAIADALLASYMVLIIILGIIGNSVVIYASTKYQTFDMDKITIFFVRHLACSDLLIVVFLGVPICVTHVAQGWVLGGVLCHVSAYTFAILPITTLNFTVMVGLHRLLRCTCPRRLGMLNKNHAKVLAAVMWAMSVVPGIGKAVHKEHTLFIPAWATCFFDLWRPVYPKALLALSCCFQIIPSIILLLANISLIIFSVTQKRQTPRQAPTRSYNKTIYLISILYFLSWIPFSISDTFTRKVNILLKNLFKIYLNLNFTDF